MYAPDAWPTDEADQTETWSISDFPNVGVVNGGQLDAYPVWQITGPAQGISIFNTTTGQSWGWGGIVPAGQTLLVDTRTSIQRFTYPVTLEGVQARNYLTSNSELWWLKRGANGIVIAIGALADANTRVQISYRQRFRGGLR